MLYMLECGWELNASVKKSEWNKLNHGDTVHLTRMGRYLLVFAHNTDQNSNGLYVASYYGDANIAYPIREASNIAIIYIENGDLRFTATATNPELYYCFMGP